MDILRICRGCGLQATTREELEPFVRSRDQLYGRETICKKCHRERARPASFVTKELEENEPLRTCNKCKLKAFTRSDLEEFQYANGARFGRANMCKECAVKKATKNNKSRPVKSPAEVVATRLAARAWHLKKTYDISLLDYDIMLAEQNNCCKICGCEPFSARNAFRVNFSVDHCHSTGKVRGLLCTTCNIALGGFGDDSTLLANAVKYLEAATT